MLPVGKRLGVVIPGLAILFGLVVGTVVILLAGRNPLTAYHALVTGAFGSKTSVAQVIIKSTPLILTGLSVAFAFRCGLFNIGAEGQLLMGTIAAAYVGINFPWQVSWLHLPLTLATGAIVGGIWGGIPGWLKAKRGVHEVINTIMMNWIAIYFTSYLVSGPLQAAHYTAQTGKIANSAKLPILWNLPLAEISYGILIALGMAYLVYWIIRNTTTGYEIRAVGYNPYAAEYAGISIGKNIVLAMAISGALAGFAGAVEISGNPFLYYRFSLTFSPGYGFDGIAVALLGRNHPAGIILAAFLFAILRTADRDMQLIADVPRHVVFIIQAAVIFFVAADRIIRTFLERKKRVTSTAS